MKPAAKQQDGQILPAGNCQGNAKETQDPQGDEPLDGADAPEIMAGTGRLTPHLPLDQVFEAEPGRDHDKIGHRQGKGVKSHLPGPQKASDQGEENHPEGFGNDLDGHQQDTVADEPRGSHDNPLVIRPPAGPQPGDADGRWESLAPVHDVPKVTSMGLVNFRRCRCRRRPAQMPHTHGQTQTEP